VVVVGSGGVGKSTLTIQFTQGKFFEEYDPTIEDSYRKQVEVDGQLCTLDILDTAEQEYYIVPRDQYMRTGQAFIVVYSITDATSLDYIPMLQREMSRLELLEERRPIVVLGNKSDLQEMREITYEDGQKIAQKFENCEFLETSAKEGTNVDEAFKCITRKLLKKSRKEETFQKNGRKTIQKSGTSCVLS